MKLYTLLTLVSLQWTFTDAEGSASGVGKDSQLTPQVTDILPSGDVDISTVPPVTNGIQTSETESEVLLSKQPAQTDQLTVAPRASSVTPPLASRTAMESAQINASAYAGGGENSSTGISPSGGDIFHSIMVSSDTNSTTEASVIILTVTPAENEASIQPTPAPSEMNSVLSHNSISFSHTGPSASDLASLSAFDASFSLTPVSQDILPTAAATGIVSHFSVQEGTASVLDLPSSAPVLITKHPEPLVSSVTTSSNEDSVTSSAVLPSENGSSVPAKKSPSSSNNGLTTSAKIGIGVVVPLCLLLFVIAGFLLYRRSRFTARSLKAMLTQRIKYKNAAHSCDEGMLIMPDRQT